jgi:PEP-CTERM motif
MRTSILGIIVSAAVGSFAFFGVASPAEAATVHISGSGVWGLDTEVIKGFSAPGASFSFSFELQDPIPSNPAEGTDFDYLLNDKGVIDEFLSPFVKVEFFTADFAGMFDLFPKKVVDGKDVVISFYGADIGSSLTIAAGTFSAAAGMQLKPATGSATVTVSPVVVTGFEAVTGFQGGVPEPSTWMMMTLGFAGLAFAGYRTSRKSAQVA